MISLGPQLSSKNNCETWDLFPEPSVLALRYLQAANDINGAMSWARFAAAAYFSSGSA